MTHPADIKYEREQNELESRVDQFERYAEEVNGILESKADDFVDEVMNELGNIDPVVKQWLVAELSVALSKISID